MRAWLILFLTALLILLPGCEAIGTIFEAGMWVGVIGVVIIVAIVWLIVSMLRR